MKSTKLVTLLFGSLIAGLLILAWTGVSDSSVLSTSVQTNHSEIKALTEAAGCTAYPITLAASSRSVTLPGQGTNPYPDAAEFEYPPTPPTYESFASHQPDVPLVSASAGTLFRLERGFSNETFNWLVWNLGIEPSAVTLANSLTWPGDSDDYADHGDPGTPSGSFSHVVRGYVEPGDDGDTSLDSGDWVAATGDVFDSAAVRAALNAHIDVGRILRLPVWDITDGGTATSGRYRVSGFAIFRLVGYSMGDHWILVEFVEWDNTCARQLSWQHYLPIVHRLISAPRILYFTANVALADPGDTIELAWATEHATTVTLYHLLPTGQFGSFWSVAASGTMTYTISEGQRNQDRFVLYAGNDAFPWVTASLTIPLNCPYEWFFAPAPDICAQDAALISPGAEQHFEHGLMLWVGAEDRIYVLYDPDQYTDRWDAFADEWQEGDPLDDPTITPPPGFYQPQRGFGLVWREQPLVRDRLGWAVAPEQGYETAVQHTSYARYNDIFVRASDGNVWRLLPNSSGWEKVFVTGLAIPRNP